MLFDRLFELSELAKKEGHGYEKKRFLFKELSQIKGKHFVGIVGPRGSGKTILLKQMAVSQKNAFYLSADTLQEESLFDITKVLVEKYKIEYLLIDEIHFQKDFERDLKKIFDFLSVHLIFTSSVALALLESSYDLSRRVELFSLYPFSFREYLFFQKNILLPSLSFPDLLKREWQPDYLQYGFAFEEYLKGGLLPFSLEEPDVLTLLKNTLQKIIQKDIPSVANLRTDEIIVIEKLLAFIGRSAVEGINFTSLSKNVGVTKYKAEEYVRLLQKSFVLNILFPTGTNVLKEPKILMSVPYRLLYKDYEDVIGGLREDFFVEMMQMLGKQVSYLKSSRGEKTPDFLITEQEKEIVIEIGGKGKGRQQFKGFTASTKLIFSHEAIPTRDRIPLFLLGFTV